MALTDTKIRQAKPRAKDWKLSDEKGLFLLVTTKGAKHWRFKYRFAGIEKKLTLGSYPEVGLKAARDARDDARRSLEGGIDPGRERKQAKVTARLNAVTTFEALAAEYIGNEKRRGRAPATIDKITWLASLLKPGIGTLPVSEVTPADLLAVLHKVERSGRRETARRLRSFASNVFCYAIATGRATIDPAQPLIRALAPPEVQGHAGIIDPVKLGGLLRAIDSYEGQPSTMYALRLAPHLFQRPGELRQAEWSEFDFDKAVWTVPLRRMKMRGKGRTDHHIPLSSQAVALLREVQQITGGGRLVFPGLRTPRRPISENTLNAALRRLGYANDEHVSHGFRSTASSLLNECGAWSPDAIERAQARHDGSNRGTYNRSPYWAERVRMAQWWSDTLDTLRDGGTWADCLATLPASNVVALPVRAA